MLKIKEHFLYPDLLSENPVIVDAGACRGEYIKDVLKAIKNCRAFCIEPSVSNLRHLIGISGITALSCALGGTSENAVPFTEYDALPEWANLYGAHSENKDGIKLASKSYVVGKIGINDLHSALGVSYIDSLKLDIEGAELDVFKNMSQETAQKIGQISVEVHCMPSQNWNGIYIKEFIQMVEDIGFLVIQKHNYGSEDSGLYELALIRGEKLLKLPHHRSLFMIWPQDEHPKDFDFLPKDYIVRPLAQTDSVDEYIELMHKAGFSRWGHGTFNNEVRGENTLGVFVVYNIPEKKIVAAALSMIRKDKSGSSVGELGWVAGDPAHKRKHIGLSVCTVAVQKLLSLGMTHVFLKTDDFRLAAIKTYLKMGFLPVFFTNKTLLRWRMVQYALGMESLPDVTFNNTEKNYFLEIGGMQEQLVDGDFVPIKK